MKKMVQVINFLGLGFVLTLSLTANVMASCGCASCPIDTHTQEKIQKGMIRVDYSTEYINQDQLRIGRHNASVGEITGHHDEVSTLSQTQRIGLDIGLTSRLSLQAIMPFVHREHQHIHNHDDSPSLETWNFNGLGDLTLQMRYLFFQPGKDSRPSLSTIIGGIFPTGRDKATNSEGDDAEAGILPGKHTTSLILGLSSLQSFSVPTLSGAYAKMPLFLSSTYQWNGKGREEYKIGNIWLAHVGLTYPVFPKVGVMMQLNLKVNRQDQPGETHEEVEKTGGTYVYATPGLQLTMSENLNSYVYVQIPVYQRVNQIQLTSDFNLMSGISYRFSAL